MRFRNAFAALLTFAAVFAVSSAATAQVHPHHAAQIRKAAKEVRPQSAPERARTVLIWNTPAHHLMDKDPHKGYCIPYGEEAAAGHRRRKRGLQTGGER